MKRVFTALGIIAGVALVLLLTAFFLFLGVTRGERLDPAKLSLEKAPVVLLDANGNEIEHSMAQEAALYDEFPAYLPNAFIAVEDKRFYEHNGFDLRRIVKAAIKNATTLSFREGASTISQQLIKNTHLTSEKTLSRKLKEFKLTRILEKNYTKEEILERYLNSIYFGHSAFGINDAAYFYFGKKPSALAPAECAMLAALVKSPNRYSPFKNADVALSRRNFVLKLMKEQGYIDEGAYDEGVQEPLPTQPHSLGKGNFYQALVWEELCTLFPDAKTGELGGLRVFTAYDPALQAKLEKTSTDCDTVLLVRDNRANAIKALHTTTGLPKRLPGSTIKPLFVYGPAIEENLISPATPILDEKTDFAGYCPDDAGGVSDSYVSARYALAKSINIPAVKTLNALGIEKGAAYLRKMGMEIERDDYSLALALGGMKEGFTLQELSDGYATFANGGKYSPSGTILRIENDAGRTLYRRAENAVSVFSEDTAFLITDMLRTAATEGTARKLKSLPFAVAAKTGTHEARAGNLDAYTIAYTTEDVVAVWMGNADNSPVNATGGGLPANYAKDILEYLYKDRTPAPFRIPESVVRVSYDKEEYETNHGIMLSDPLAPLLIDPTEYFRAGNLPKEQSTRFTRPTIQNPSISVQNGSVKIVLCHAEYYDYIVKRENRGETATIYSGAFREVICDNSVKAGESYVYTVVPVYKGKEGAPAVLPRVQIEKGDSPIPDGWWSE